MKTVTAVILAALLAGCATPGRTYYKEGVTQEQFGRDQIACRQYGMQSVMSNGLSNNMFSEIWVQKEAGNCMAGLGYR